MLLVMVTALTKALVWWCAFGLCVILSCLCCIFPFVCKSLLKKKKVVEEAVIGKKAVVSNLGQHYLCQDKCTTHWVYTIEANNEVCNYGLSQPRLQPTRPTAAAIAKRQANTVVTTRMAAEWLVWPIHQQHMFPCPCSFSAVMKTS